MEEPDPRISSEDPEEPRGDLARRLARYRQRLQSEGRTRAVRALDQAIRLAGCDPDKKR